MKILLLLIGLGFIGYPIFMSVDNIFLAIILTFIGLLFISQLRDKPKIEYLGSRPKHYWRIKK